MSSASAFLQFYTNQQHDIPSEACACPHDAQQAWRLRVHFVQTNRLALLSHLELARSLERMIRRARLPFALSQGFSPHMKIAFGAALPVGVGSFCEIFDLSLTEYVSPDEALRALQGKSVESLMPTCAYYIPHAWPAASIAYPYSLYQVRFDAPYSLICMPQEIEVVRKRKKKLLVVDNFLLHTISLDDNTLALVLKSCDTGSLRLDLLCEEFCAAHTNLGIRSMTKLAMSDSFEGLRLDEACKFDGIPINCNANTKV